MPSRDTMDKVIPTYMASLCSEPFTYKGIEYKPRELHVSPLIFRGFTCPAKCGACCPRFSLDYLPDEPKPDGLTLTPRMIVVNHAEVLLFSDLQLDHSNHHCKNLNMENGRCGIHGRQPFSCDFELMRFMQSQQGKHDYFTQKLYGRGWNMLRVDGKRGAKCEMLPPDEHSIAEVERKLTRLKMWADHFGIKTKVPAILEWVRNGDRTNPLILGAN